MGCGGGVELVLRLWCRAGTRRVTRNTGAGEVELNVGMMVVDRRWKV